MKRQTEAGKFAAYLGNAGDSRGILLRLSRDEERKVETYSEWEELIASDDHKPDRPDEKKRILEHDGIAQTWLLLLLVDQSPRFILQRTSVGIKRPKPSNSSNCVTCRPKLNRLRVLIP